MSSIGRRPGIDVRVPGYRSGGYLAGPGSVVGGAVYAVEAELLASGFPLRGSFWRRISTLVFYTDPAEDFYKIL